MPTTNYYTVNGMLIGEKTTGSNRIDYLTDALGNVTATVDQSANIINTYRYKPYGGLLAKTGAGADPAFQWVGNQGYRNTGKSYSDVYIRRRHYSSETGRWTTKDPMGNVDGLNRFAYVRNRPIVKYDPSGLQGRLSRIQVRPGDPMRLPPGGQWCGHTRYIVGWRVAGLDPSKLPDGDYAVIIQKVTHSGLMADCTTGVVNAINWEPANQYWELWKVNIDNDVLSVLPNSNGWNDNFEVMGGRENTMGFESIVGRVKYQKNYPAGNWRDMNPRFPDDPWGQLTHTLIAPEGWSEEGALRHELVVVWNCCPRPPVNPTWPILMLYASAQMLPNVCAAPPRERCTG